MQQLGPDSAMPVRNKNEQKNEGKTISKVNLVTLVHVDRVDAVATSIAIEPELNL